MKSRGGLQGPAPLSGLAMRIVEVGTKARFVSSRVLRLFVLLVAAVPTFSLTVAASGARSAVPAPTRIAAGNFHTCAVTLSGGAKCWGGNNGGQLGSGLPTSGRVPVDVVGLTRGVRAVAAGNNYSCAVTLAGAAKCWGYNGYGQLGNGSTQSSRTQVDVVGLKSGVSAIAAGYLHTCAITSGGAVKCWGDNSAGQLGNGVKIGSSRSSSTPVDVVGLSTGVIAIDVGWAHSCALTGAGGVKCWGDGGAGQLGDGKPYGRGHYLSTPIDVVGLAGGVRAISAGPQHTCAITAAGGAKCWGRNYPAGSLGNGPASGDSFTPVDVVGLAGGVSAISAGGGADGLSRHTCVLLTRGGAKCWGQGGSGQLGNGSRTSSATPVEVVGFAGGAIAIVAGGAHTCVLMSAGGVKCWGGGAYFGPKPVDVLLSVSALKLTLGGASPQRLLAQQGITVTARCSRPCSLSATGSVRILRTRHVFGLARTSAKLAAAGTKTLMLRLPAAQLKRFARLFAPGQQSNEARAVIRVKASDGAGHTSTATRTVAVL